jgi:hypothetical protein
MTLLRLESQPDFPAEDISDANASILEFLMQNKEILNNSHNSAELAYFYRLGHHALTATAQPQLNDNTRLHAFSHGIGTYEAVSMMVRPNGVAHDEKTSTLHIMSATHTLNKNFVGAVVDAKDRFTSELPNTAYVIGESAARFYDNHTDYALSGAAIARELEQSTLGA